MDVYNIKMLCVHIQNYVYVYLPDFSLPVIKFYKEEKEFKEIQANYWFVQSFTVG